MTQLQFTKLHGIGNDFIVCRAEKPESIAIKTAVALCDRHFGIGADGVLLVTPPTSASSKARMTVINADGSQPEMCGNGLRCVALFLAGSHQTAATGSDQAEFVIDTDAGPRTCLVEWEGNDALITTSMGRAVLEAAITHPIESEVCEFARISMGNPHAICLRQPISESLLDQIGPELSARIDNGTNVEIATLRSHGCIDVSVWERGVGRTLACGTGAAATAVAAIQAQMADYNVPVEITLPGGTLEITVNEQLDVMLRGPAQFVFEGDVHI